jgi:hypothetical protein
VRDVGSLTGGRNETMGAVEIAALGYLDQRLALGGDGGRSEVTRRRKARFGDPSDTHQEASDPAGKLRRLPKG